MADIIVYYTLTHSCPSKELKLRPYTNYAKSVSQGYWKTLFVSPAPQKEKAQNGCINLSKQGMWYLFLLHHPLKELQLGPLPIEVKIGFKIKLHNSITKAYITRIIQISWRDMASLVPSHSCLTIHQARRYTVQNTAHGNVKVVEFNATAMTSQKPSAFSTKAISQPFSKLRFYTMVRYHYQFIVQE